MSKDCRSDESSALEASDECLAETRGIDMASTDLNVLAIGAGQLREGDRKIRIGSDSVCGSDGVPEDGGGRPPDAPKNTRQSKELQTGVRQASAGS